LGDKLRLTVEVPRSGFLYVIDREQYRNGKIGDPLLIFPTKRTNGGNNRVSPGWLVEIPSRDDNPPFFELAARKPAELTGEALTLIVTAEPILGLGALESKPLRLDSEQVAMWEAKWGGASERYEMVGGSGKPWTEDEKAAGAKNGAPLTHSSPLPQTIYRVLEKPGEPVLITVSLLVQ
jgi:hypothetical protein